MPPVDGEPVGAVDAGDDEPAQALAAIAAATVRTTNRRRDRADIDVESEPRPPFGTESGMRMCARTPQAGKEDFRLRLPGVLSAQAPARPEELEVEAIAVHS